MHWQIVFAIFLSLLVALTLLRRKIALTTSTSMPASITNAISYVFGVMPISFVVGFSTSRHIVWSGPTVFLLALEGICIAGFTWIALVSLRRIPPAHFQTIFQLSAVVVVTLGWVLLGETLRPNQLAGGVLILIAGMLAIWAPVEAPKNHKSTRLQAKHGILLAVAGTIVMGIGLVAEKAALKYMNSGAYFIYGFGAQCIAAVVIASSQIKPKHFRILTRRHLGQTTLLGFISAMVGFTYIAALAQSGNLSLITALKAFALPLTAIAAHYILKERNSSRSLWFAIWIGVAGLLLIAL